MRIFCSRPTYVIVIVIAIAIAIAILIATAIVTGSANLTIFNSIQTPKYRPRPQAQGVLPSLKGTSSLARPRRLVAGVVFQLGWHVYLTSTVPVSRNNGELRIHT